MKDCSLLLILFTLLSCSTVSAQSTVNSSGGEITTDNYISSFSIGQVFYETHNTSYTTHTGIQMPFIASTVPVTFLSFQAQVLKNNVVRLMWQTAMEQNNSHFEVHSSKDGTHWKVIASVNGKGNSTSTLSYDILDTKPYNGISHYRLKQVDFNGEYSYSDVSDINITQDRITIYPNPVDDNLSFYYNANSSDYTFIIISSQGHLIKKGSIRNTFNHRISFKDYPSGIYTLLLLKNQQILKRTKFIKI